MIQKNESSMVPSAGPASNKVWFITGSSRGFGRVWAEAALERGDIVSQLRNKTSSKPEKDLRQAAALIEALVERYPGAIEDAASAVPKSAARHMARAIKALEQHLPMGATAAWDTLRTVANAK